eukprot:CAMPEP_0197187398 /NCGR_PEP_ID=MMETSP1423-20130617/15794_1 /TAXON_ID=476441 /ORGANISM="Pseudo-nitzschia heimii, Strain UNC1101" /LENGTH=400 /DNA_ID=CAMNT_0042638961 /DNA_START=185 /DNA_END=1387 /DNA_ORIENTATION=-
MFHERGSSSDPPQKSKKVVKNKSEKKEDLEAKENARPITAPRISSIAEDDKTPDEDDDVLPSPRVRLGSLTQIRDDGSSRVNDESDRSYRKSRISMVRIHRSGTRDSVESNESNGKARSTMEIRHNGSGESTESDTSSENDRVPMESKDNRNIKESDHLTRTRRKAMSLAMEKKKRMCQLKPTAEAEKEEKDKDTDNRSISASTFDDSVETPSAPIYRLFHKMAGQSQSVTAAEKEEKDEDVDNQSISASTFDDSVEIPSTHIRRLFQGKAGQSLESFDSFDDVSVISSGSRIRKAIEDAQKRVLKDDRNKREEADEEITTTHLSSLYQTYIAGSLEKELVVRAGKQWTEGYRQRRRLQRGRPVKKRVRLRSSLSSNGSIASSSTRAIPTTIDEMGFATF